MWEGFCTLEVSPSPKDHAHDVGELAEESANWTVSGDVPVVTAETNEATGAVAVSVTVIYADWETVLLPPALLAVRVTV
jgi:hypothetical protein